MRKIKLRDGFETHQPYPVGEFPPAIIESICERIVHLKAIGKKDMSGDEFSGIFAGAISGRSLVKPIGIADVTWNGCCWTVKTVKNKRPHTASSVRLISGRNSPIYSSGISDPLSDLRLTGQSVLDIFNNRINQAKQKHDDVRLVVLVRNMEAQEFTLFERPIYPLVVNRYSWEVNERGNLCAFDGDIHAFTWQPHGSLFTIHEPIPSGAARFRITREPKVLDLQHILNHVGFDLDWIDVSSIDTPN